MISPQGYSLGEEPKSKNPFWDGSGEDSDVNRIYATATVDDQVGTPSVQTTKTIDGHDITFGFNFHNLKGAKGDTGATGATGATGERGPAGPTGATGAQGPKGDTGERGPAGETGPAGPAGPAGADGQDGVTPDITMSATADATSSANPTVTVTKSGTAANPAFALAFSGLKGEQGIQGPAGSTGAQGPAGQDGATPDISMSATADATSSANPTVTVTKSGTAANPAFALAFSGLKGEQGIQGIQGVQGPAGSTGPQGPAGPGVPTGGTAGQVLQKVDGTDYNTEWATLQSGGGLEYITYIHNLGPTLINNLRTNDNIKNGDLLLFVPTPNSLNGESDMAFVHNQSIGAYRIKLDSEATVVANVCTRQNASGNLILPSGLWSVYKNGSGSTATITLKHLGAHGRYASPNALYAYKITQTSSSSISIDYTIGDGLDGINVAYIGGGSTFSNITTNMSKYGYGNVSNMKIYRVKL